MRSKYRETMRWFSYVVALVALMLLSCTSSNISATTKTGDFPNDPNVDRSFVTGQPCYAPCWQGLNLDVSTVEEVQSTLRELPFVDQTTLFEYKYESNQRVFGFDCTYYHVPGGGGCGVLETSIDGTLKRVVTSVQYPLSLRSVIDQIGNPEFFTANPLPNDDVCLLEIYWPEKKIITTLQGTPREKFCAKIESEEAILALQIKSLIYTEVNSQDYQNLKPKVWPP